MSAHLWDGALKLPPTWPHDLDTLHFSLICCHTLLEFLRLAFGVMARRDWDVVLGWLLCKGLLRRDSGNPTKWNHVHR